MVLDVKVELTKPALLACVAYLVLAFVILLPLDNKKCDSINGQPCYNFGKRVLTLLLMLIPIGLSVYSINCMMVGKCAVWSWVNSIIIAVWVLLFIVAIILSTEQQDALVQTKQQHIVLMQYQKN